jgi:CBS domain-containing protein
MIMTDALSQQPAQPPTPATVADVMRPPLTTADQDDHAAAAAYLMKHAGTSALVVIDAHTAQPLGIVTERDIAHAVADGKDLDEIRIHDLMTARPTVIHPATSIRDAAKLMARGNFRHLPVSGDTGLIGMLDITDVCRALIDPDLSKPPTTGNARSL